MSTLNKIDSLIKYHLSLRNLYSEEKIWRIQDSPTEGRGLFTNRDINPGEIIFTDYPLLTGPRAGSNYTFHCVVCCALDNLHACTKGCGLPVCSSECELSIDHIKECEMIRKLSGKIFTEINSDLFRCLSPLRVFLINKKLQHLLSFLIYHSSVVHGNEVDAIKPHINLNDSEENFLKIICSILDTNTFATVVRKNDKQISVRALYPLSAFLNHSCCPNVTHLYDSNQQMIVKAAVFIPQDAELFISYTSLLWGTSLRRLTQFITKHFWCHCNRCKDPKEFGSCLSALKCTTENCGGNIYSSNPLNNFSDWKCDSCNSVILNQRVGQIQSELGVFLRSIGAKDIEQLIILIKEKLGKLVPSTNHINYEVRVKVIWCLGHKKNYLWNELTVDQLNFKEMLCKDVLELMTVLKLGLCKMRGLILYELYRTRQEKYSRTDRENIKEKEENEILLKEAAEILKDDVSAPPEIGNFFNSHIEVKMIK